MSAAAATTVATAYALAAAVPDPELPVVTIAELGILRDVARDERGRIVVTITPTYSGCPALEAIRDDVLAALRAGGVADAEVHTVLRPAWTTDWISAAGRRKLREHGIAPPGPAAGPTPRELGIAPPGFAASAPLLDLGVCCPRCGSFATRLVSRFGATACQAQYACEDCREPFDHFKPH